MHQVVLRSAELILAGDIADRPQLLDTRDSHVFVDGERRSRGFVEPHRIQPDAANVRHTASGNQNLGRPNLTAIGQRQQHPASVSRHHGRSRSSADLDALRTQHRRHQLARLGFFWRQDSVQRLDDGDLAAEPGERLRQFQPDRTATEHDQ